jgi:hypothetical protein
VTPYGALGAPNWREIYLARLEKLGVEEIRRQLVEISARHGGKDLVLLCYEDVLREGDHVCHRRAFSSWWEEKTGEVVDELPAHKPAVEIVDGSPAAVLLACRRAARRAGWTRGEIEAFVEEASAGDYEHLQRVTIERFHVEYVENIEPGIS